MNAAIMDKVLQENWEDLVNKEVNPEAKVVEEKPLTRRESICNANKARFKRVRQRHVARRSLISSV